MKKFLEKIKLKLALSNSSIYASPLKRIGSGCVDLLIILILFNISIFIIGSLGYNVNPYKEEAVLVNKGTDDEKLEYSSTIDMQVFSKMRNLVLLISAVYYTYFLSSKKQATIGNQVFKIMVVDTKKGKISILSAFIRYIAFLLSNNLFFLGYLTYFFTKDHCFLQDLLSDTRVINVK